MPTSERLSERVMVEALIMHPVSRSIHRCRVRLNRDGLLLCRVSGDPEAPVVAGERTVESAPIAVVWRSLRGFSADESYQTPGGRRLQVLEVNTDEGNLTLLAEAPEVSVFLAGVGRWSGHWRFARSPLGVVLGGARRRLVHQVA